MRKLFVIFFLFVTALVWSQDYIEEDVISGNTIYHIYLFNDPATGDYIVEHFYNVVLNPSIIRTSWSRTRYPPLSEFSDAMERHKTMYCMYMSVFLSDGIGCIGFLRKMGEKYYEVRYELTTGRTR